MDEDDAKLYWVESEGSAYTFMKSNLDGSDAEKVRRDSDVAGIAHSSNAWSMAPGPAGVRSH